MAAVSLFWNTNMAAVMSREREILIESTRREGAKIMNRVFSHDVTAAILVSQNNKTAAVLVSLTNPLGVELFSYANVFFCSNKFP